MSVAKVALNVVTIAILFVRPWLMDQALVVYSHCTLAAHIMSLPRHLRGGTTLSGNLCILLDQPICTNTIMCLMRLLSFRMHTAITDEFGSSKQFLLKNSSFFFFPLTFYYVDLLLYPFLLYKNSTYTVYPLLRSAATIIQYLQLHLGKLHAYYFFAITTVVHMPHLYCCKLLQIATHDALQYQQDNGR